MYWRAPYIAARARTTPKWSYAVSRRREMAGLGVGTENRVMGHGHEVQESTDSGGESLTLASQARPLRSCDGVGPHTARSGASGGHRREGPGLSRLLNLRGSATRRFVDAMRDENAGASLTWGYQLSRCEALRVGMTDG